MSFNRLETAELRGKTALVRVDFNVPRDADGKIPKGLKVQGVNDALL